MCGVSLPHDGGTAGLAAVTLKSPDEELDGRRLKGHLNLHLPTCAHPVFFRVRKEMDLTATCKYKKVKKQLRIMARLNLSELHALRTTKMLEF